MLKHHSAKFIWLCIAKVILCDAFISQYKVDNMGEYIDMFAAQLEQLKRRMDFDSVALSIMERMRKYWIPLPQGRAGEYEAVGADSSVQSVNLSTGYTLLVVRACVAGAYKKRTLKAYLTTGEVTELGNRLMEDMENKILGETLSEVSFVDGSLYGRASHVPLQFRNDGFENFMLEYYKNYNSLISKSKKKNVKLIGISKSAGTTFLRDLVVKELYDEELQKNGLDEEELQSLPYLALDRKNQALKIAEEKLKNNGFERAYRLIAELTRKRPDASILTNFGVGMSVPVILGASARARRRYKELKSGKKSLDEIFRGMDIDDSHTREVLEYLNTYAFVSFYISFSPGFLLRVDIPSFVIGIQKKMQDIYWPQVIDNDMSDIISIVESEHGDGYVHNIHLYAADLDARLPYKEFMNKYYPLIEQELELNASTGDYRYIWRGE